MLDVAIGRFESHDLTGAVVSNQWTYILKRQGERDGVLGADEFISCLCLLTSYDYAINVRFYLWLIKYEGLNDRRI